MDFITTKLFLIVRYKFRYTVPNTLNWVRLRPGICDGGATLSPEGGGFGIKCPHMDV